MATITIDGTEYQVKDGDNLLQASLSLGLDLPYFCWHPAMGSIGACRQCAVVQYQNAEDQRGRIVMGCMTPVTDGAIFSMNGDKAKGFREAIVESLMLNHPHDCPVCAEGGECHLQDMTVMVGHRDRNYRGLKNTHRNQDLGPLIHHEMNRCITCYRCTRYYNDYAGGTDLAAMAAHDHIYFGRHEEGVLESEFAGNLVEVCPTGVFTDKTLVKQYTRKWDLQSAPSVCTGCAVGCNTLPGERYGKLKRVHNRYNDQVNGYFLCDRGRFGASFVNHAKRLDYAGLCSTDGRFNAISQAQALAHLSESCSKGKLAGIGSPRASVESNYLLRSLVSAENFCPGFSTQQQLLVNQVAAIQQHSQAINPSLKTIESADAILILGEDPTQTAPRIALALRQSVRNKAYTLAAELKLAPWQDAAVRNLAQDQLSPLFIVSVGDSRLDDIAEQRLHMAPDNIARFASDIALLISGAGSDGLISECSEQASDIAEALRNAQRPLIISGTGCGSAAVIDAAAAVADALVTINPHTQLSLSVPEANSFGQALLAGADALSLSELGQRAAKGSIDTLVVMENDLYRRGAKTDIDQLLSHIPNLIVLDCIDNPTLSASSLALPAASFIETEGTLVSMEGRAQRHFPLIPPSDDRLPSWRWLLQCMQQLALPVAADWQHFDDISLACANDNPALAGITAAAPDHLYRNAGLKIPRQPPRYSGRTAMRANVSVHEPKQPEDNESSLSFSMEGVNSQQPGALLPYVWAPGWNSNQSLHKFQAEVGGPLKGGTAGCKLSPSKAANGGQRPASEPPAAFTPQLDQWLLSPRPRIFGSDELSALSSGLASLIEPAAIEISTSDADRLGVVDGDGLVVGEQLATLEVRLNDSIAAGCAGYSVGIAGSFNLIDNASVTLTKAMDWKRRQPQLIGSDRGGHV
jgi:NADH-quinone oxidoreductase subunit G